MFHTPTFEKARKYHKMVAEAEGRLGDTARSVWNALTGRGESGDVADAIALTMPEDYFPLLHGNDGVPACFALTQFADIYDETMSGFTLRAACNNMWTAFEERRKRANAVKEGLGWDLSDAWMTEREVDDPEVMEDIAEIARLAGRMYEHIRGVKVRSVDGQPEEVETVTVGGDVDRLIASEMAQLTDAELGDITAMRIIQRKALQFQFRGDRPAIRGPLVIAIDESGSMGCNERTPRNIQEAMYRARFQGNVMLKGARNRWAKACAAALTRVAHDQDRLVRIVHFSTVTTCQDLKRGDTKGMLQMMRTFLSGGNDIGMALHRAVEEVGDLEHHGYQGADAVLISDGVDYTDHHTPTAQMQEKGIKLWSISIDVKWTEESPLVERAAKYVHVEGDKLSDEAVSALRGAAEQNR